MRTIAKIALNMPGTSKPERQFSFRIKQDIYIEPCEYPQPLVILAISDIEGNFMSFLQLLVSNKVIDRYLRWTFGEGHLVIVGDCFDRGEQVVECLWLIYSLEEKARKKGGYVHFILGNHEIMNLNGDWRYMHPKYAQSSKFPYTALYNGNDELHKWLCSKNIIEKIGNILFVHGGIAPGILQYNLSVSEMNEKARPWYARERELSSDPILQAIFSSDSSPFWFRGYYQNLITEEEVNATLNHFGVTTIVTGHTMVERIAAFYNGKVINIDTDHAMGRSEALLIRKGKFYRVNSKGKREKII